MRPAGKFVPGRAVALDVDRFCKVLALAGSASDGEALSALRRARAMLADSGLSFTDIAARLGQSNDKQNAADRARADLASLIWEYSHKDKTVRGLQQRIGELQAALAQKDRVIDRLRRELAELIAARHEERRHYEEALARQLRPPPPPPPEGKGERERPGPPQRDAFPDPDQPCCPAPRPAARPRRTGRRRGPAPGQLELALW